MYMYVAICVNKNYFRVLSKSLQGTSLYAYHIES